MIRAIQSAIPYRTCSVSFDMHMAALPHAAPRIDTIEASATVSLAIPPPSALDYEVHTTNHNTGDDRRQLEDLNGPRKNHLICYCLY